jgi:hypothetical protein
MEHLANAWALRRWRGLLYRVRDVYRAAGALICLAAGCTGFPHDKSITDTLNDDDVAAVWPGGPGRHGAGRASGVPEGMPGDPDP